VNVDHVATLRQARGTAYPDPVHAAELCERAGAQGITVHLREDRRHIQDRDVEALRKTVSGTLNLEMAATDGMAAFAERVQPDLVTLVPEKRQEQTTEGGLDVVGQRTEIARMCDRLKRSGIAVSLFIDPESAQVLAAIEAGADAIELHTGDYANADLVDRDSELARLVHAAAEAERLSPKLRIAAGHGLTVQNVGLLVTRVPCVVELNIGHALVGDAVFVGMEESVRAFRRAITAGEEAR